MASYEQNKSSKLWSVRFREKVNGKVKNQRLSGFKTKREAQQAYVEYAGTKKESEIRDNTPEEMKFEQLVILYMEYHKGRVKESSYYDDEYKINSRILPFFKGKPLSQITPVIVLEWQSSLSEYSYRYQKNLVAKLSSVYRFGAKYYGIENVMDKVDRPRNTGAKPEMQFWTPDEFAAFIRQVKSPDYKMLFEFLYITGCRRGEALALSWNDIDMGKKTVRINKSVTFKAKDKDQSFKVTTPKNVGSNRIVSLPDFLCEDLAAYRQWQAAHFEKISFVFNGEKPLPPTTITRVMQTASDKAGVKRIRVHDLRHSCASFLIHSGLSIVAVSKRLGHNNVEQTLNTYSHMMPDDHTMMIKALDRLGTKLGTKD